MCLRGRPRSTPTRTWHASTPRYLITGVDLDHKISMMQKGYQHCVCRCRVTRSFTKQFTSSMKCTDVKHERRDCRLRPTKRSQTLLASSYALHVLVPAGITVTVVYTEQVLKSVVPEAFPACLRFRRETIREAGCITERWVYRTECLPLALIQGVHCGFPPLQCADHGGLFRLPFFVPSLAGFASPPTQHNNVDVLLNHLWQPSCHVRDVIWSFKYTTSVAEEQDSAFVRPSNESQSAGVYGIIYCTS